MHFFPHGDIHLHVLGEPSALFTFSHTQLQEAAEQLLHPWGAQAVGTHQCLGWEPLPVPLQGTDERASTAAMPGAPCSYAGAAETLFLARTGLNISHRRFLLQSSCQTSAPRKESLYAPGFAALPASSPSNQEKKGKLKAINTVNVSIKFFWELRMLLSTGKLKGRRGKGHFTSFK